MIQRGSHRERALYRALRDRWVEVHEYDLGRIFLLLSFITTLVLVCFDPLIFDERAAFFRPFRMAFAAQTAIGLFVLQALRSRLEQRTSWFTRVVAASPGIVYNSFAHWCLVSFPYHSDIILCANLLCMALTMFYFYRLAAIINMLHVGSMATLVALSLMHPQVRPQAVTLMLSNVLIGIAAIFLRQHVGEATRDRYNALTSMLPIKVAEHIAVAGSAADLKRAFAAKRMHTVCVNSDWRNYQELMAEREPEEITRLFEIYYEAALDELDRAAPDGNFYASWTADELFVVFYADADDAASNLAQASSFVMAFATDLSERVRRELGFDLLYDIGVATGPGLIGLQGPHRMKKTTVVAEAAGHAKRLETEAKLERRRTHDDNPYPVVAMDVTFGAYLLTRNYFPAEELRELTATTKDIRNHQIFIWQMHREGDAAVRDVNAA